ncbi:MAG: hypothetical protein IVW55_09100 [Chloroflexi bacterium]|nr:hypothetical protein [Chloroflexota bacterium]
MKHAKKSADKRALDGAIAKYWGISLTLGAVVVGVVALLLNTLTRTAEQINGGAAQVWETGKLIANNTVHIPMLARTNQVAANIVATSEGIAGATSRIQAAVVVGEGEQAEAQ